MIDIPCTLKLNVFDGEGINQRRDLVVLISGTNAALPVTE